MTDASSVGAKPTLDIEVDLEGFEAFKERFDEFQEANKEVPQPWLELDDVVVHLTDHMEELAEAAGELVEEVDELGGDGAGGGGGSGGGKGSDGGKRKRRKRRRKKKPMDVEHWVNIFKPAKSFTKETLSTTHELYKWTRVAKVFTALIGAGGLFGIDRMAIGAGQRRMAAGGAGVTIGENSAFNVNFGRLGNSEGMLGAFSRAQHDMTARTPLYALGVGKETEGLDAAQAFAKALPAIKKLVDKTDPRNLSNIVQAYKLNDLGIGLPQALNLKNMKQNEIDDMIADFGRDQHALDTPDNIARQWQDFTTQMERSADRVEIVFAKGAIGLAGPVMHLSDAVLDLLQDITEERNGPLKGWIDKAGNGITWFAGKLGNPDALSTVGDALKHIDMSAKGFENLNEWIGSHTGTWKALLAAAVGFRTGGLKGALMSLALYGGYEMGSTLREAFPEYFGDYDPFNGDKRYHKDGDGRITFEPRADHIPGAADYEAPQSYRVDPADKSKPVPELNLKGNPFSHPDVEHVDPRLREIMAAAQTHLPPGYSMRVTEGYNARGHAPNSQHHIAGKGAMDIVIFGPDGKPISNRGDEAGDGVYHRLARGAYGEMLARHPELKDDFAWGGAFETSRGSGQADLMHFDIGGHRDRFRPQNDMRRMGPLPEQLHVDTVSKKHPMMKGGAMDAPKHPTADTPQKQSGLVIIHDNLGGSGRISVA